VKTGLLQSLFPTGIYYTTTGFIVFVHLTQIYNHLKVYYGDHFPINL